MTSPLVRSRVMMTKSRNNSKVDFRKAEMARKMPFLASLPFLSAVSTLFDEEK